MWSILPRAPLPSPPRRVAGDLGACGGSIWVRHTEQATVRSRFLPPSSQDTTQGHFIPGGGGGGVQPGDPCIPRLPEGKEGSLGVSPGSDRPGQPW